MSNCESECILWGICRVCTAPISVVPAMSSSYNPLPRAAGKIQYEAETKPRSSNCILQYFVMICCKIVLLVHTCESYHDYRIALLVLLCISL